jgi:transposase
MTGRARRDFTEDFRREAVQEDLMTGRARRDFTEDFRREAVRLTQTSGRTIGQIADDLGIGRSTLTRWKSKYREAELLSGPHDDVEKELARLRKENELLRQERDLLKKATAFFARETSR